MGRIIEALERAVVVAGQLSSITDGIQVPDIGGGAGGAGGTVPGAVPPSPQQITFIVPRTPPPQPSSSGGGGGGGGHNSIIPPEKVTQNLVQQSIDKQDEILTKLKSIGGGSAVFGGGLPLRMRGGA